MSPFDFNPFASAFVGGLDNNLFFGGHHTFQLKNHHSSSQCSGLRLKRETENAYIYVSDAPGIKTECLQMTLEHTGRSGTILISNELDIGNESGNTPHGIKSQRLHLPSNVDTEGIVASVANGVLTITVSKRSTMQDSQPHVQMTKLVAKA